MKVTFIVPCVGKRPGARYPRSWQMEPLAIAQLSALTPHEWERRFYDDRIESIPYDESTDLVAINVETYSARRAYQIADCFRRRGISVIMGGFHATMVPDEVAAHADVIVIGEAEGKWPQLLADVKAGRLQPRYASAERPEMTGMQPDWSIYGDKRYVSLALTETGRGCCYGCEFCSISSFFHRSYRARPVEDVVEEVRRRGAKNLFFVDDHIAVDPDRTRSLLEALTPLRIRWVGQVSLAVAQDESLLKLFSRSGCMGVLIGFESMNPASLEQMGKRMNDQCRDYDTIIPRFRKHGLGIYATFMFGYDDDTEDSFRRTLDFAIRHQFFFTAFNHLVPFPAHRFTIGCGRKDDCFTSSGGWNRATASATLHSSPNT